MESLTITCPDDWHVHLRDNEMLAVTVRDISRCFARAIVMPNLKPPVLTCVDALAYRERIVANVPENINFTPLMTLYLTDNTPASEIIAAINNPHIYAIKYYPAGATTNSDSGVTRLSNCFDAFAAMEAEGLPLLVHGEVTDQGTDIFDREKIFIDRELIPLIARFPKLKLVVEHITTAESVAFVQSTPGNVAATITPQHLLFNRNDMLAGGIRPHLYCLPVLKRNKHQQALLDAATSGNPKFFLGTDSAPHLRNTKENACGCAGCYSAASAIELYAQAFDQMKAIDKLEAFASHYGPDFYGLPRNNKTITLRRKSWKLPGSIKINDQEIIPLLAGEELLWQMQDDR
jgi:dihydroorotase